MQVLSLLTLVLSFLLGGSSIPAADTDTIETGVAGVQRADDAGDGGGERDHDHELGELRQVAVLPARGESFGGKRGARRPGPKDPRRRSEALGTDERVHPFTEAGQGARASHPRPGHGGRNVPRSPILSWRAAEGAVSHDVWFGTGADTLVFQGNQLESRFELPELGRRTRYSWRIDEVDAGGRVTPGDVWTFRTARA